MEETDDPSTGSNYPVKRLRLDESEASRMIVRLDRKEITESSIEQSLREAIEAENPDLDDAECKGAELAQRAAASVPLYIIPLYNLDDPSHDIETPHFTFRPIQPMQYILASSFTLPRSY